MRYPKGTVVVSRNRDVPLLEYVLRCGFVTSRQLFEFLQLDRLERSRAAFEQRLRRLAHHDLIRRYSGLLTGHEWVYSIAPKGVSLLVELGELYAGRGVHEQGEGQVVVNHWLDINDIHLALRRRQLLVRWTPESEIRSQNDLTTFNYAKDYDAIVTVRCDGLDCRFALEYERFPKTRTRYEQIGVELDKEVHLTTLLYLAPTYHVLSCMRRSFEPQRLVMCLALSSDFVTGLLDTPVVVAGRNDRLVCFGDVLKRSASSTSQCPDVRLRELAIL
jgi:hypothetical protein